MERRVSCGKESIAITSTGVVQTTDAARVSRPSRSPVSPKKSPGPSFAISVGGWPARADACAEVSTEGRCE